MVCLCTLSYIYFLKCAFDAGFMNCDVLSITVMMSEEIKLCNISPSGSFSVVYCNEGEKHDTSVAQAETICNRIEH
jgi:hypothetical protein